MTNEHEKFARYFGLQTADGYTDRSYPDLMEGLKIYTDNCLYFAELLCDVLSHHATQLAPGANTDAPTIKRADFSPVRKEGLLPDPKEYIGFGAQYRPKKIYMAVTM